MNFKLNFEQYKQDQKKLEQVPTIKPDFYFVLNDIAKKIINNEELKQKEINDLEMVYDMAQDLEKELINSLDKYRSSGIITKPEFLISADYFLTANQNGPKSDDIKDGFTRREMKNEDFLNSLNNISIPSNIRELLKNVFEKITKINV